MPAEDAREANQGAWVKILHVNAELVEFGSVTHASGEVFRWHWISDEVPVVSSGDILVLYWKGNRGHVNVITTGSEA